MIRGYHRSIMVALPQPGNKTRVMELEHMIGEGKREREM